MPLLAGWIGSLFSALGLFLAKLFLARLAIKIAGVAAITAITGGLMFVFNAQVAPLVAGPFSTSYGQLLGLLFPPVAGTCIAAMTTIWLACSSYQLQRQAVQQLTGV